MLKKNTGDLIKPRVYELGTIRTQVWCFRTSNRISPGSIRFLTAGQGERKLLVWGCLYCRGNHQCNQSVWTENVLKMELFQNDDVKISLNTNPMFRFQISPTKCRKKTFDVFSAWLRWYDTLKYGDFHEKLNVLKIQDLRPLNTCRKHFEMILLIFL